jgi:SAM-dependent methyltransferase
MLQASTFQFPPLAPQELIPIWEKNQFRIGDQSLRILDYLSHHGNFGWTDSLTAFHESQASDNHSIDQASRQHALDELQRYVKNPRAVILEVGCSSGFMLQLIKQRFLQAFVLGADIVREPLECLGKKIQDLPLLRFDLTDCPLADESVDAIILLNVLEHIEADNQAMAQVKRILKPGGVVILEVPAGPNLFDIYDKMLLHYRRYTRSGLCALVEKQGFVIKKSSYLGCFLYPAFWLVKKRNHHLFDKASIETIQQQVANNIRSTRNNFIINAIMKCEMLLGKWISYPIGIRCLMTCVKE